MKPSKVKNRGVKMTAQDVRISIEEKKERLARQMERKEQLEQTIQNTSNDIEQLEYTLVQMESVVGKMPRMISPARIEAFFTHVLRFYERIQRRLRRSLNYVWFCIVLSARYRIESRVRTAGRQYLSPCTMLNYFKREREQYLGCRT